MEIVRTLLSLIKKVRPSLDPSALQGGRDLCFLYVHEPYRPLGMKDKR